MQALRFEAVCFQRDTRVILNGVSFAVAPGETLSLLGPSGAGKSTVLRLMNRMLTATGGRIFVDGQDVHDLEPVALRRRVGYVMQDFGLLPHWTVAQNIELVPRLLEWPGERRRARMSELVDRFGLGGLEGRYPHQISGGQKQRVGVARALAAEPSLLLFDEPFAALDPVMRKEMQDLFLSVREQYRGASVFVTHDVAEAMRVGTQVGVLANGRLEGIYSAEEFRDAQTPTARAFLDTLPRG